MFNINTSHKTLHTIIILGLSNIQITWKNHRIHSKQALISQNYRLIIIFFLSTLKHNIFLPYWTKIRKWLFLQNWFPNEVLFPLLYVGTRRKMEGKCAVLIIINEILQIYNVYGYHLRRQFKYLHPCLTGYPHKIRTFFVRVLLLCGIPYI